MTDLLALTASLVDIPSVSKDEAAITAWLEAELRAVPWLEVTRVRNSLVARTHLGRPQRLLLAGHTDTVPVNGNAEARIEGDTLWGVGSTDMKSGLAVQLELARTVSEPAVDVTYVFYECEEIAAVHNGLRMLLAEHPELLAADAAILGEGTNALVEAGCQGTLRVLVTLRGERAHSARPWMGTNAVHRLGRLLDRVDGYRERQPVLSGCTYREALQAVAVTGGVAGNVVPDLATVTLNHRYAPDRDGDEALAHVLDVLGPTFDPEAGDTWELTDRSDGAMPNLEHPLLASLVTATSEPPLAKLGWTDVAFFAAHGIPATNYGPGDPSLAHTAQERVERSRIERCHHVLRALLTG
ncbi:MAG: N-succinyl-L,L-diaminopimelate desuccinylase [uncultured Acidimicrobiales bacterium]|uniref:Succinyl-diaminopimelate desuccinylase n=1 Tax=uncultured Acidimicrobiales bacterium TaxID=310071 RepID=A0A6J4II86_9ACTN|nr:MAG: N-succinyl-L,L-diaminopimelate desuccinylase [uncultured Acidimicrobiales bacterium]